MGGVKKKEPPVPEVKRVFVCSPLRGDVAGNIERARQYCRTVVLCGHLPYAPHLFFPQFLNEYNPAERELGLRLALREVERCDELWVFADTPSEGMLGEIKHARHLGIPVKHWNFTTQTLWEG